jgi:hypothetical protein
VSERGTGVTAVGMLVGTAVFVGGDAWLSRDECTETMRRSRQAAPSAGQVMPFDRAETARGKSIAAGIFVDGVPESIALGLTVADSHLGVALLVGVGWQPGRGIRRRATDHRHRVLEALRGRLIAAIGRASPGRRRPSWAAPCPHMPAPKLVGIAKLPRPAACSL